MEPNLGDLLEAPVHCKGDWGDVPELVGVDDVKEFDEAIRVLKETDLQDNFEARKLLSNSYLSRHGRDNDEVEHTNIYFDQAMKTRAEVT